MIAMQSRSALPTLLALLFVLASTPVAARMYQWDDPDTGTPQLSGKPPWWYRGDEPGPRVFVIENGKVVDDTSVAVPDAQRQLLRQEAFQRAEDDEARFRAKLEEAQRMRSGQSAEPDVAAVPEQAPATETAEAEPVDASAAEADSMRALVEEWERIREETAKKVIHE